VVLLALPPTTLGTYAVSRRSSFSSVTGYLSAREVSAASAPTLLDIAAAQDSPEVMRALSHHAGEEVTFVGFVERDANAPSDEFQLTRFVITCCIPDALLVQVRVVDAPPGRFTPNQWVQVSGALYPVGTEVLLDAQEVKAVPRPRQPYLYP
jgi:putative membrane protein